MRDLVTGEHRRNREIRFFMIPLRRGLFHHLREGFQTLQDLICFDAVIDQARNLGHANCLELFDTGKCIIDSSEQTGIVEVPFESKIKDAFQIVVTEIAKIQLKCVLHALRLFECRERPGILLDQSGGRTQVILHRLARDLASHVACIGKARVQHQCDGKVVRVVPSVAQRLSIQPDLFANLFH